MLKKRLIPVLLLKNGRMVKGRQFRDYRDTGDPISASRIYNAQKADELMFLDIDASSEGRSTLLHVVQKVSEECFMPFTVGGGVQTVDDVRNLLNAGADKVLINSAAVTNPSLVEQAANMFGQQCIISGVDVRREDGHYRIYTHGASKPTDLDLVQYIHQLEEKGAGEFLINSIDRDGMMIGYDGELLKLAVSATKRPVIACGGAGNFQHLAEAFGVYGVHAVACASLFHFGDNNPIRARAFLKNQGIPVKNV
ncbi:MAG: glycosyl amidation-associated protein WbuZ [Verrucomicrobia bacterium]|nr:glycosyl amidation-associated protein WbuZ [Verrucomicrobiota bacterium]MBU4248028.1 glycosyl amidation-associated protein WbuZ [Verrucomicrobiota bacterium]MBU4289534.1 glycosyl amidation-associated protein WbuZ [Verrucomicrobiota bacterium]MBU4496509.1 glycosyl amidation-associated protein WbuZ [Verrucomicrobiota bacterium]MCG2678522.1 glycosyl amidation-associated protein WbuZ [Kiritimatiellia bacterium]